MASKIRAFILALSICFGLAAGAEERQVTLLYTNDIESVYEPVEAFWNPDIELIGGILYLATLIEQVRSEEELSFLFDAGDIYTEALSQASEGRLAFDLYSLMGYDVVNLVVVLTHQNRTAPMQTDKEADPEVQRGFDEDYALAGELRGVDVIFGGHSDNGLWEPVRHPDTGTLIGMTFGQGKYLRLMRLTVDTDTGKVELDEGRLIPVESAKLEPDAEILQTIAAAREQAPHLSEVVGQIETMAFRRYYRESNLGNLLADILKEASGADIAVTNSGSLRADFNPGEVTAEEVLNVYPFIGKFHVVEISGDAVHELLEYSYALHYGYAQMSGVEATCDSRNPVGERLLEARVGGEPLDPNGRYTVASSAFLANGGDGYSMLAAGKPVHKSPAPLSQSFLDYFETNGNVSVPTVGRQKDLARRP